MKSLAEGLDDFYAGQAAGVNVDTCGNRPWSRAQKSVALAVHPSQVQEAAADAAAKGVPTDFAPDGRPEFRDRKHRASYMRAYGFFDRDAGYGDAAPQSQRADPPPARVRELARQLAERIRVRRESRR